MTNELLLYLCENDLFMSLRPDVVRDRFVVTFRKTHPHHGILSSSVKIPMAEAHDLVSSDYLLTLAKNFMDDFKSR